MRSTQYKALALILTVLSTVGFSDIYAQKTDKLPQRMSHAMSEIAKKPVPGKGTDKSIAGWIDYEESVSENGARIYDVPLRTSPLSNFAPQISLRYNSQKGNGIAGYGWEIGGISQITIIPKTLYYHNEVKGADIYDPAASYALDGVPIVACKDAALSREYPLETIKGNIVLCKHNTGGILTHFTALYPDGTKAVFGDPNSENLAPTGIFRITQKEDRNGNIIEYIYDGITPASKLTEVVYRHRDHKENIGSLTFEYEVRSDSFDRYYALQNINCESLLKTITSTSGKRTLCYYSLTHEIEDGVNLLTEIKCIAPNGDEVRPLTFSYGQATDAEYFKNEDFKEKLSMKLGAAGNKKHIRGHFSKDEKNDGLIILPIYNTYDVVLDNFWGKHHQYGSTYPPEALITLIPSIDHEYPAYPKISVGPNFQHVEAVDIDNDGIDEIVQINFKDASSQTGLTTLAISIYKYNNVSNTIEKFRNFEVAVTGVVVEGKLVSPLNRKYLFGDFDGLGKVQMATILYANDFRDNLRESQIAIIDLGEGKKLSEGPLFNLLTTEDKMVACIDIDGDGKTELCHATEKGLDVYNTEANSFNLSRTQSGVNSVLFQDDVHFTDINGDGYMDIVRNQLSWEELLIYRNVENSFMMDFINVSERNKDDALHFADVNQDGLPDMLFKKDSTLYIYPNILGSFPESERITSNLNISKDMKFLPDKPGTMENGEITIVDRNKVSRQGFETSKPLRRVLTTFVNSLGKVSFNHYQSQVIDNTTMALLTQSRSYLNMACAGEDCLENISYEYHEPYISNNGLGFCGFKKLITNDCRGGKVVEEVIERTMDPEMGENIVTKCTKTLSGDANPYEVTDYTYTLAGKDALLTQVAKTDKRTNVNSTVKYTYDNYGNPTLVLTNRWIAGESDAVEDKEEFTYSSNKSPKKYVLGDLSSKTITRTLTNGSSCMSKEEYNRDSRGNVISEVSYEGASSLAKVKEINRTFDQFGKPQIADGSAKTSSLDWGGVGLYTITHTSSNSPTEVEHYDAARRLVRKEVQLSDSTWTYSDILYEQNGLVSCISRPQNSESLLPMTWDMYTYDSYLRPSMIVGADGDLAQWEYNGNVVNETINGIGCRLTKNAAGFVVKAVHPAGTITYDLRADGKPTLASMKFDGTARSTMIHKVHFSYDKYGRRSLVKDIRTGNQIDSTVYKSDGTSIHIRTNPNGTVSTTSDVNGNIVKIEREGGDTSEFEYDDYGRLTSATSSNGASKIIFYDALGRILEETNYAPDDIWFKKTFSYDAFGNIESVEYASQAGVLGTEKRTYANGSLHSITFDESTTLIVGPSLDYICQAAVAQPQLRPWPEEANAFLDFLTISYAADGKPTSITMEDLSANFTYDGQGECIQMLVKDNSGVKLDRHYLGGQFEIDQTSGKTIEKLYLGGNDFKDSPIVFIRNAKNSSRWLPCIITRDSQGNITSVSDFDGTVYEQLAYDPWGQIANPQTGQAYPLDDLPVLMLGRGFHSQEHLNWFALINIDGRIYDPTVGCWITPYNYFFK